MALDFCDSFDTYSTSWIASRYASVGGTSPSIVASGRTGVNAMSFPITAGSTSFVVPKNVNIATPVTVFVGAAISIPIGGLSGAQYIGVYSLVGWGSPPLTMRINADGSITNSFTGMSAPAGSFIFGSYQYVEFVVIAGSSTLECQVWVNDNMVGDGTVSASPQPTLTQIQLGAPVVNGTPTTTVLMDDLCVYDNTGSYFNLRTGDVDVYEQVPVGPGRVTGVWGNNGGGGSQNWQNVDEIPPDSDTSFIQDATPGDEECFALSSPPNAGQQVLGMQVTLTAKKTVASGSRTIAAGLGNGTSEAFAAAVALGTSYTMIPFPFSADPITGGAFDPAIAYQAAVETVT